MSKPITIISLLLLAFLLLPSPIHAREGSVQINNPYDNPPPEPDPADNPPPQPTPPPQQHGPFFGLGQPWAGIEDAGYCPGYGPSGGFGWDGVLSWPSEQHYIRDGRHFRVGHTGTDIDMPVGTEVYAAEGGRVVWSGYTSFGFGELVVLAHGGGWLTFYAHLSATAVACGQYVNTGGLVGLSGMTGAATWPHLHFELRNGDSSFNPLLFGLE